MPAAADPAKKTRSMPARRMPEKKTDGFAVGVSQGHYWTITALAQGLKSNRAQVLERIINHYIETVVSKAVPEDKHVQH